MWILGPEIKIADGNNILHTLSLKHFNDFIDKLSSVRGRDEVTKFFVEDQGTREHRI